MALPDVVVQQLFENTIKKLAEGQSKPNVWQYLVNQGLSDEEADYIIEEADKIQRVEVKNEGKATLFTGIIFIILSIVISFISIYFKSTFGGYYVITTGMFLMGVLMVLKSFWSFITKKRIK